MRGTSLVWGEPDADESIAAPPRHLARALWLVNIALTVGLLTFLALTSTQPLTDDNAFRQTQTALSVYYALKGGLQLDYITPVLGAPWAIPFEAPIYHWVVAFVAAALPLEVSGRVVSAGFLLGAIAFGYGIVRLLVPPRSAAPALFVTLALGSPLHVFWGRAFLIESCALFFGMAHLYYGARYLNENTWRFLVGCGVSGVVCVLAKATTWPSFTFALGMYALARALRQRSIDLRPVGLITAMSAVALLTGLAWTAHADALKMQNPLGVSLTSGALHGWNWGTFAQRIGSQLWFEKLPGRMLPDILGSLWVLGAGPLVYGLALRRSRAACAVPLAAFLFALVAFPNLHIVHNYYQMANAAFLLMAVAVGLGTLFEGPHVILAGVIAAFLLAGQITFFVQRHRVLAFASNYNNQIVAAARHVRDTTGSDTALVAIGVDWSSIAHFYAQRKGIAVPPWASVEVVSRVLDDLPQYLGGLPLASIIDCRAIGWQKYSRAQATRLDLLVGDFRTRPGVVANDFGRCRAFTVRSPRGRTALTHTVSHAWKGGTRASGATSSEAATGPPPSH